MRPFTIPLIGALLTLAWSVAAAGQPPRLSIQFEPQTQSAAFIQAAADYAALWAAEGARMLETMERVTGVTFEERDIKAIVFEGPSSSGFGPTPMRMRASYRPDVKKATLIHELLHRMLGRVRTTAEIDEHRKLFLVLYDIWVALYGKAFADRNVVVESARKGLYDYDSAWKWALAMSAEERASQFQMLRKLPDDK